MTNFITIEQRKQLQQNQINEARIDRLRDETVDMEAAFKERAAAPDACRECRGYGYLVVPNDVEQGMTGDVMSSFCASTVTRRCHRCNGFGRVKP